MTPSNPDIDVPEVYRRLQHGTGHELVHDGNVNQLIQLAVTRGDPIIEALLREWVSPCSPPGPSTPAENRP